MKARFALALGLIALAAFTWRVGYILTVTQHQQLGIFSTTEQAQPDVVRSVDEYYYAGGATNIVHGKAFTERLVGYPPGTPVALHPPLTEVVLAPTAWIFDGSQLAMRITVAAAGALVVVVIGLIGRDLRNERAGLIAAGLAAVHPSLWVHDGLIMSETFAALATALIIWCTYRLLRRPGPWPAIATGVMCGLAALARSELIVLAPLVVAPAIWFGTAHAGRRRRLTAVAVLGLATLLTILPWTIYNLGRFEKTVLLSYGDGSTIQGANCDRTYHGPAIGSWDGVCARIGPSGEPSVVAAEQRREGFAYISDHAGRLPVVVAARLGRVAGVYRPMAMLDDYQREGKPFWASFSGWLLSLVLLPFAAYGLRILRRRTTIIPLVGVVVVVLVTAAMFYGNFRIRVPIDVVLVICAAVGLDAAHQPRSRTATPAPAPTP